MIRSLPTQRAEFSFSTARLGATGTQLVSAAYTGVEQGAMLIPVVGPFVAAAAAVANAFGLGKGCGPTCTQSTQVVNAIEPILQQNLAAAQQQLTANGGCLLAAEVTVLVQNFQSLWQQVLQGCGQIPAPGGTQCIADRQPGGKFDWTAAYLTPITNMPVCPETPPAASSVDPATGATIPATATSSAAAATTSTIAGLPTNYVLIGAGLLGLYLLTKS
jgi:hypothetical protein